MAITVDESKKKWGESRTGVIDTHGQGLSINENQLEVKMFKKLGALGTFRTLIKLILQLSRYMSGPLLCFKQ